ncbi:hypothetical protein GGR56DRAFT_43162 [Xylariaceae sp. FL0804]|nr:hypothetical protein GGR56DRAFT_43162 [Xylariaceae sp. FL0804]
MGNDIFYAAVPQTELKNEECQDAPFLPQPPVSRRRRAGLASLWGLLLISVVANAFLCYQRYLVPWQLAAELPSRYANLPRNVPTQINYFDDFQSEDRAVQDAAWDGGDFDAEVGIVALEEDLTRQLGLRHSQRWPWDSRKGVYVTIAAHELHCLRALRESVNQNYGGVPLVKQAWSYGHIMHCLNVLRVSIMCHADDEPMYVGYLYDNVNRSEPRPGLGQIRMCRDWGALLDWSRAHTACYKPIDFFNNSYPEFERYKYCPDGARPWDKAEGS